MSLSSHLPFGRCGDYEGSYMCGCGPEYKPHPLLENIVAARWPNTRADQQKALGHVLTETAVFLSRAHREEASERGIEAASSVLRRLRPHAFAWEKAAADLIMQMTPAETEDWMFNGLLNYEVYS